MLKICIIKYIEFILYHMLCASLCLNFRTILVEQATSASYLLHSEEFNPLAYKLKGTELIRTPMYL